MSVVYECVGGLFSRRRSRKGTTATLLHLRQTDSARVCSVLWIEFVRLTRRTHIRTNLWSLLVRMHCNATSARELKDELCCSSLRVVRGSRKGARR